MNTDEELLRYSRQILLPEIGIDGQQRLLDASVLVVGCGGLGSPIALYLAAAGVGQLLLADADEVDLSNLQRQIAHGQTDIGRCKAESARDAIVRINPDCQVEALCERLDPERLDILVARVDLVLDATDNFATRFAINRACRNAAVPLVSGAAIRWEGQVSVFPGQAGTPCYRCLYTEAGADELTCSTTGVIAPLVGIIGSVQALEAIKILTKAGESLAGRLLLFDGLLGQWRSLRLNPDPLCPICSTTQERRPC
jgi:adenylyltransferase/sulfurtransferase